MNTQPEALRLAEFCDGNVLYQPAAAELRRQHGEIESLRAERLRSEHRLSEVEAQLNALLEAFNGFAIPKDIEANITEKYEFIYYLVKFAQEQERERIIKFLQEMQRSVGDAHNHYGVAAVRIKEGV